MKLSFKGKPRKVPKKQIKEAVNFFSDLLLSRRLSDNIDLLLVFIPDLVKTDKVYGYCNYDEASGPPRTFTVEIDDNISKRKTLITLAHEIVHVKQYAKGELRDYIKRPHLIRWQDEILDEREINYYDNPSEIEANGREYGMYRRFQAYYAMKLKGVI